MILTKEQFRSCLTGVSVIKEESDGFLLLNRFFPEQIAIYPPDHRWVNRSYSQTSITLDFHTNSTTLSLRVRKVGSWGKNDEDPTESGSFAVFELYENGVYTQNMECVEDGDLLTVRAPLSPGEKRVTVYVPRTTKFRAAYGDVELTDGASFTPHRFDLSYVAFGDSITNGDDCSHASMIYVNQLGRMLNARIHNFAIGGMRYLENTIVPGTYPHADLVTVSYGTNDYHNSQTLETMCRECRGFMEKLIPEFPGAKFIILLPIWRATADEVRNKGDLRQSTAALRGIIEQYPVTVIDCYDFLPHVPDFFADGLHPNDMGTVLLGQQVCHAVEKVLVDISRKNNF